MSAKKNTAKKTAKVVAKKSLVKKVAPKKKEIIKPKKTAVKKKVVVKKAAPKAVAKKAIKKVAVKKPVVKKPVIKKLAVKKPIAKKPIAKKPAVKKAVIKKQAPVKTAIKETRKKIMIKKVAPKKIAKLPEKKAITKKEVSAPARKKMPKQSAVATSAGELFVGGIKPYQPVKNESYMSKGMQNHFRKVLMAWKKELMEKADFTVHHMKDEAANYADPNDRASQEEEFSLELRARDRERRLIRKIEETLDLIDVNNYGHCEECGEEIGLRRLEARPTASLCVDCKTLSEIKEKQTGV
jgi:DnaK suppressor protein